MSINLLLTSGMYNRGMWTPEQIAIELSRLEREAHRRVRERMASQQLGLAFVDLPEVTTQPSDGVKNHGGQGTQKDGREVS